MLKSKIKSYHILFLDDEPRFGRRYIEFLQSKKYNVHTQVQSEINLENLNKFDLIIHCCHNSQTHEKICSEIQNVNHLVPVIHLPTKQYDVLHCGERKFHRKILNFLQPFKAFNNLVKEQIKKGELIKSQWKSNQFLKNLKEFDELSIIQESQELIFNILTFFSRHSNAENIFWFSMQDLDFYHHEIWRNLQNDEMSKEAPLISSFRPESLDFLSQLVKKFNKNSGHDLNSIAINTIFKIESQNFLVAPIYSHDEKIGFIIFQFQQTINEMPSLNYWCSRSGLVIKNVIELERVKNQAYIDDVTSLFNQRYMSLVLDREIAHARRRRTHFSVLFIDIDHFKKVNDFEGHLIGTKLIREISVLLKKNIRNIDYGFRYGGDEFILLLIDTDSKSAFTVGERIRKQVEEQKFLINGIDLNLTLSIGIASFPEHAISKEEIIHIADKAMYSGKNKSRNIVFVAS